MQSLWKAYPLIGYRRRRALVKGKGQQTHKNNIKVLSILKKLPREEEKQNKMSWIREQVSERENRRASKKAEVKLAIAESCKAHQHKLRL